MIGFIWFKRQTSHNSCVEQMKTIIIFIPVFSINLPDKQTLDNQDRWLKEDPQGPIRSIVGYQGVQTNLMQVYCNYSYISSEMIHPWLDVVIFICVNSY